MLLLMLERRMPIDMVLTADICGICWIVAAAVCWRNWTH